MKESALPYWLTFAVLLAGLYGVFKWRQVEQQRSGGTATVAYKLPPLTDFELMERSGKVFRSADMKGKVWVASFFFATCPGSCTRLNSNIKRLTMLDEIQDVTWVSITVDPENDTLSVLREYADRFGADPERWLFCRGELPYIKRLADDVLRVGGVTYKGHNDYAVIVDKQGRVAGMFNASSTSDSAKAMEVMKQCLAEEPPTSAAADSKPSNDGDKPASESTAPRPAEAA